VTSEERGNILLAELRHVLGQRWDYHVETSRLRIRYGRVTNAFVPPRRVPDAAETLALIEETSAAHGVPRAPLLPLRWGAETDLTISAVQALDPYLKDGQPFTYRRGFLPQPVVRFTGPRDERGRLREGVLTSFINVSCVQPVASVREHVQLIDMWLTVLSRLGLHASHLEFRGDLSVWSRGPVQGVTLHILHAGLPIGDAVLLWNREHPENLATDLGSGLERLRWTLDRRDWPTLVFGAAARSSDPDTLDAIRTATLLVGSGIRPSARGPGSAIRRVLRVVPAAAAATGLGRAVRDAHTYWSLAGPLSMPPVQVATVVETTCLQGHPTQHTREQSGIMKPGQGRPEAASSALAHRVSLAAASEAVP
jgi:hypothetical protein